MIPFLFQNPWTLLLLPLLFLLGRVLAYARARRRLVLTEMGGGDLPRFAIWRDLLRLAALGILILALARPGFNPTRHSISQSGRDVVFILDVSRSMLAEDASPNRLTSAKNGIRDALESFTSERVGLVIYAGSANILCPLTYDYNFVRYMLDQASTRAVDFGGTVLLSAVEKCLDSVLIEGREGMHDLVVLTDGEEHGAQNDRVTELIQENDVGLLLLGIGDAGAGSRIPITDTEGNRTHLKFEDQFVTTRLRDLELRDLVNQIDGATYVSVGDSGFDLAGLYQDYVHDKPVTGATGDDTFVTYREVGFALIGVALLLIVIAEGRVVPKGFREAPAFTMLILGIITISQAAGASTFVSESFETALEHQQEGRYEKAIEAFQLIIEEGGLDAMNNSQVATLRFNEALCFISQAETQGTQEPQIALALSLQAQRRLLDARRLRPDFERAGQRLDPVASMIVHYEQQIAEEQRRQEEIQEQMKELVEQLQKLLEKQTQLREQVPKRPQTNRGPDHQTSAAPERAAVDSSRLSDEQRKLLHDAQKIEAFMAELDQAMLPDEIDMDQLPVTILHEPRQLMSDAVTAQERAIELLLQWSLWPDARVQQQVAIDKVETILELLASDSSDEWDEGDWEDWEEDWGDTEYTESEGGMNASMEGQGDLAAGAEMQALPVPNYSVEDILREEQGSLQFRQQQRATANQGKVEKDW
ncbi:MAG: VWA domain-containing protein [Verrucomicrobiota bacterium]